MAKPKHRKFKAERFVDKSPSVKCLTIWLHGKFREQRRDKKSIQLVAANSISYNASTHQEKVEAYLHN